MRSNPIHVALGGNVVAIDPETGHELWRRPLKPSQVMTLIRRGSRVVAAAAGELWCLNAASGEVVWHNKLKGLGIGYVAIAGATVPPQAADGSAEQAAVVD
jgi:outer membrane protein assembly factor BamB